LHFTNFFHCSATQRHLLTECDLLSQLTARIEQYSTAPSAAPQETTAAAAGGSEAGTGKREAALSMAPKHTSVMGNLLLVAQVGASCVISATPRNYSNVHA
jgi:hypothetical protein